MNYKLLNIKIILLFGVGVIALTLILSITVFINEHNQLQTKLTYLQLQQTVATLAALKDKEIELAIQNVHRLKGYMSILDTKGTLNEKQAFIQHLMAENLQFENNHYSSYMALEPKTAQQYFNERGKLLLVHKNIAERDTVRYNKPQYMLQKSRKEPSYAHDPRNSWYYQCKHSQDIKITPIYFDATYTNTSMFSISQGLYKHKTFQGVVGVSILVDTFFEDIEKQTFGLSGGMFLADYKKGLLLSKIGKEDSPKLGFVHATERQSVKLYQNDLEQPFWKDILTQNIPYMTVPNNNGHLYTLSSKQLQTVPWTLVSYQRTSELNKAEPFDISDFIAWAAVVLLLLSLMTLVLFKMLIWPLSKLLKMTQRVIKHPDSPIQMGLGNVVELRNLAEAITQIAAQVRKQNNERTECIKRLYASRLTQAKQARQFQRCHSDLEKVKADTKNSRLEAQKAHLQIQKTRVEIQKYKLDAQRAKVQSHAANQAKAQFLSNMSRELRTPMNAIIGYTEILQEDAKVSDQESFLPDLQKIHGASYHLLDLINNLFDMSKIESSKMDLYIDTYDIAPMIQDVVTTITPLLEKQSNILKVHCEPALGTMSADLTKVRQNLLNLLSNANKFSKQSTITLTVIRETIEGIDWILFRVTDQGIGMTKEQIQKVFQAFVQVDGSPTRQYGGSGLGLAITKQFCQIMGGEVTVKSQFGKGSTFTMRLPAQANVMGG